jgi:hypothetical protein
VKRALAVSFVLARKLVILFFLALFLSSVVISGFAQVNVGLREGDWVEYTITYIGNPPDTYPETARIEVEAIQGTLMTVETERTLLNGTQTSETETFDLEDGAPNLIVIPANLGQGDEINHKEFGTVTLQGVEDYSLEGTTRQLVYAVFMQTRYGWDRTTGILVEANQERGTFTWNWTAAESNIVQTSTQVLDIYAMLPYLVAIATIIILAVIVLFVIRKRRSLSPHLILG